MKQKEIAFKCPNDGEMVGYSAEDLALLPREPICPKCGEDMAVVKDEDNTNDTFQERAQLAISNLIIKIEDFRNPDNVLQLEYIKDELKALIDLKNE